MDSILIRPAVTHDASVLSEIALKAKAHWGYARELIELWRKDMQITPEKIVQQTFFVAHTPKCDVGFAGIETRDLHSDSQCKFEVELTDLWILPEHMGKRDWQKTTSICH